MIDLVTSGWLTTDDIVLEDGTTYMAQTGGGALYSAVGAALWGGKVGVHAPAGAIHADRTRRDIAVRGLDTEGIAEARGNGLELWLLHESDVHKQQIRKLTSSELLPLDADRGPLPKSYETANGIHIAPQGPESSHAAARSLRRPGRVLTMDILADAMIDAGRYAALEFINAIDAFLPSESEIERIWSPVRIEDWLVTTAKASGTPIIGKIGAGGSLIAQPESHRLIHVPAFPVDAVDTTGAGDGYCGGFLAGLAAGKPLVECAAMGTVSASYVVSAFGALSTPEPIAEELDARFATVLSAVTSG